MALSSIENLISFVNGEHSFVHLDEFVSRELSVVAWSNDVAIIVHNSKALHLFKLASEVHLGGESVGEHVGVDLVHGAHLSEGQRGQHRLLLAKSGDGLAQHCFIFLSLN